MKYQLANIIKVFQSNSGRTRDELEFLPAALEIIETPANPLGRKILWAIMVFFMIAVVWALFGKVDIVAIAHGKIIPAGQIKIIQPVQASTVKAILVEEGQWVDKGQILIELDSTQQGADITRLEAEAHATQQELNRIASLLNRLQIYSEKALAINNEAPVDENDLLVARIQSEFKQYQSQMNGLQEEIKQHRAELRITRSRISQLENTLPLITERAVSYKKMLKDKMVSRNHWLELEQQRIEKSKELEVQYNRVKMVDAAIGSGEQKLLALKEQIITDLLSQRQEAETKRDITQQEIIKAHLRNSLQQLVSPTAGVIQQLAVHTIGGVVTPAQELMRIVPDEGELEVEAFFKNEDIGFVKEGQIAEIKVDAFPFTKYGTIRAEVITLSNDAVPDEDLGLIYTARVKMKKSMIRLEEKYVKLIPGMSVSVEARTGDRRLIEFLMAPLLRYRAESVRER